MPAAPVLESAKPDERLLRSASRAAAVPRDPAAVGKKIWIDLENTPHIPFFKPIIRELEQRGYTVVLTARDAFQVCETRGSFWASLQENWPHLRQEIVSENLGSGLAQACSCSPLCCGSGRSWDLNHGARAQIPHLQSPAHPDGHDHGL